MITGLAGGQNEKVRSETKREGNLVRVAMKVTKDADVLCTEQGKVKVPGESCGLRRKVRWGEKIEVPELFGQKG